MQKMIIVKPLELADENYGNEVKTTIQVGKLQFEVRLSSPATDEINIQKPEKLETLEAAGVEFDYTPILEQYRTILSGLDAFRASRKERKARQAYQSSEVVKMELPAINGAEIRIETEDDYVARQNGWTRYAEPHIFVIIDGFKSVVSYGDTGSGWRQTNNRMRFIVSNGATEGRERQYSKLETCVQKLLTLVPDYLVKEKARKESAKRAEHRQQLRAQYITANFPNAVREKYGKGYNIPVAGRTVEIDAVWHTEREAFVYFKFNRLPFQLTKKQVEQLIKVLSA